MCHSTAPFKGQGLAIHGQVHQALMVEARLVRGVHAGHHALCNILPVKNYTHWHIYACAVKVGSCHAAWLASNCKQTNWCSCWLGTHAFLEEQRKGKG